MRMATNSGKYTGVTLLEVAAAADEALTGIVKLTEDLQHVLASVEEMGAAFAAIAGACRAAANEDGDHGES